MKQSNKLFSLQILIAGLVIFFGPTYAISQDTLAIDSPKDSTQHTLNLELNLEDTLEATIYFPFTSRIPRIWADTLLDEKFRSYERMDKRDLGLINLGQPGSFVFDGFQKLEKPILKSLGVEAFQAYRVTQMDQPFLITRKTLIDLYFVRGRQKDDNDFAALFSKNINNKFQFTFDFKRLNNLGLYTNQRLQLTNLLAGLKYAFKRWNVYLSHYSNTHSSLQNGGISSDTLYKDGLYNVRLNYPIKLNAAQSRLSERGVSLLSEYRLTKDSAQVSFSIFHEGKYSEDYYKFWDSASPLDTVYYGLFFPSDNQLRQFARLDEISNKIGFKLKNHGKRMEIKVGAQQLYKKLKTDNRKSTISEIGLFGFGTLDFNKILFTTAHQFYLSQGKFVFDNYSTIDINLNFARLEASYRLSKRNASTLEDQIYINDGWVYDQSLTPGVRQEVMGKLTHPKTNIAFGMRLISEQKPIYWDSYGLPIQSPENVNILQYIVELPLHFNKFYFHNKLIGQTGNLSYNQHPDLVTKHAIYYEDRLFKKVMQMNTGFELGTYYSKYTPNFSPVTGQFYNSSISKPIQFYNLDYFMTFKVKLFRISFRLDNIQSFWNKVPRMPISRYPYNDFSYRIGIGWTMTD